MNLRFLKRCIMAAWSTATSNFDASVTNLSKHPQSLGNVCLAVGVTIGYGSFYYVFSALLFHWDTALDWGKDSLALAFMVSILVAAGVSPFAGKMVDAGRGRLLLFGGMIVGSLALLAMSFVNSYAGFLLCWVVLGLAQGCALYDPLFAFITRNTAEEAPKYITRVTLIAGFASSIALPSGAFLADIYGWRGATLVFAAVAGLIGAPMAYVGATLVGRRHHTSTPSPPAPKGADTQAVQAALRRPEFWIIFTAFPLVGLAEGLILIHLIPLLIDQGLALTQAVLVASLFGPLQVVGRIAMIFLTGKVRTLLITIAAVAGIAGAVIVLKQVDKVPMLAALFIVLFGASYGLIHILKPVVTAEVLGRTGYGGISGVMAVPFLLALALSPYLGALLEAISGYDLAMNVALLCTGVAVALFFVLHRMTKA